MDRSSGELSIKKPSTILLDLAFNISSRIGFLSVWVLDDHTFMSIFYS